MDGGKQEAAEVESFCALGVVFYIAFPVIINIYAICVITFTLCISEIYSYVSQELDRQLTVYTICQVCPPPVLILRKENKELRDWTPDIFQELYVSSCLTGKF